MVWSRLAPLFLLRAIVAEHRERVDHTSLIASDIDTSIAAQVDADSLPPVVIASPGLEEMAQALRRQLKTEAFEDKELGPAVSVEKFSSKDPNIRVNWKRITGRRVIFLFDTVDQSRLFEQLCELQALQGYAVPDEGDEPKWKHYLEEGTYAWGRASHITVVLPWYRPCQMERTSRWSFVSEGGAHWTNEQPDGLWLDVPAAQYMARLLATTCPEPPVPGPRRALDGKPLKPLWRPPLELLFVELHEEEPVKTAVRDLGATIRTVRFVPYFLEKHKAEKNYAGTDKTFVLFPDHGAYKRYHDAVVNTLGLNEEHILYIPKKREGEQIVQEERFVFPKPDGTEGEKKAFEVGDSVVIIDDFTNSGNTLFGAVDMAQKKLSEEDKEGLAVTIFVSHLVARYDLTLVEKIKTRLKSQYGHIRFMTTNTIPSMTDGLKKHDQVTVLDVSDFIASLVSSPTDPTEKVL